MRLSRMPNLGPILSKLALLVAVALVLVVTSSEAGHTMPAPKQTVWRFIGKANFEQLGVSVASAGDLDGDGVRDVLVGLLTVPTGAPGNHTSARVFSGKTAALLLELPAPTQSIQSNNVVAALGDLNGDNKPELLVGTPGADVNGIAAVGAISVFNGANGAVLKTIAASGLGANAYFGASLAVIDDVDADGIPDLLAGAPGADYIFAFSGKWTGNPATSFELHVGTNAASLTGGANGTYFGASVARLGVIDDSGKVAVVVGAPNYLNLKQRTGRVYVLHLGSRTVPTTVVYTKDGDQPGDLFGIDVAGGVDLNNDGKPDFLGSATGVPPDGPPDPAATGYVKSFSGANGALVRTFTSNQANDGFGFAIDLGGRCANAPTLLVGAPTWVNANSKLVGRAVVYDAVTGSTLSEIAGEKQLEGMGMAVGGFVDITGDGNDEFLAGAPGTNPPPFWGAGAAYVFSCVDLPLPDITASPKPVDMGNVPLNMPKEVVVTVTNQGTGDLVVNSTSLVPGSNPAFSITNGGGNFTLAPSATRQVTVRYTPSAAGLHGGTLRFQSNDPDSPTYDIPLAGKGIVKQIEVTPASVNFGDVDLGSTGVAWIKVKNTGNVALAVSGVTVGGSGFGAVLVPALPKTLQPGQHFNFQVSFAPANTGSANGTASVASDAATPNVQVPLVGNGVTVNLRPTARITMEVPYNDNEIRFHGDGSTDPDGTIVSYAWDFGHDGATSNQMNPVHVFPCTGGQICRYVVRLTVTDNGGKSDPTSVSVLAFARDLRSRFYGTIIQGGGNVPDGTVVSAWIGGQKVAETQTQTHLGQSVFAIEIPPKPNPGALGGKDGDTVGFQYGKATANQTGIWYTKTDQELNLTAPLYVPPLDIDWCVIARWLGWELCGLPILVPPGGLEIELEEVLKPPIPDPGPLRGVGRPFRMEFFDGASKAPITQFGAKYKLSLRYTDAELAEAGVTDENSLRLFYLEGGQWLPAVQTPGIDAARNELTAELDHATIFGLFGASNKPRQTYLPVISR